MKVLAEQTERSPLITFDNGELKIVGRSYMNNAVDFYKHIIREIEDCIGDILKIEICLDYFNTSSSKCFLEIFKAAERRAANGVAVYIVWKYLSKYYEMREAGEDYRDLVDGLPFEIIEIAGSEF